MEQNQPNSTSTFVMRIVMVLLFFLFVFIVLVLLIKNKQNGYVNKSEVSTEKKLSPTPVKLYRTMKLKALSSAKSPTTYTKGQLVKVGILGDSQNDPIVGYDILVTYDPQVFEFVSAEKGTPLYDINTYSRKLGFLDVTGTQSISVKSLQPLQSTYLAFVTLRAKKATTTSVTIQSTYGKQESKMIGDTQQQYSVKSDELQLEIH